LANALFLHARAEELPSELNGVASEVYVHLPWGSLLHAVAAGDQIVLSNLRRICTPLAQLKIFISLDAERDRSEINSLELPQISREFLKTVLRPRYEAAGFEIVKSEEFPNDKWPRLRTSWAKRLQNNRRRSLLYVLARAVESPK
jgi:16S rRNA (adenine(1408)-N(1))-methyltransferase